MKKVLSVFMAVMMMLTSLSISANVFAEDSDEPTNISYVNLKTGEKLGLLASSSKISNLKINGVYDEDYYSVSKSSVQVVKAYYVKGRNSNWYSQNKTTDKYLNGKYRLVIILKIADSFRFWSGAYVSIDGNDQYFSSTKTKKLSDTKFAFGINITADCCEKNGIDYKLNKNTISVSNYHYKKTKNKNVKFLSKIKVGSKSYKVTKIATRSMRFCEMKSFSIPKTVTSIGYASFSRCNKLKTVSIPKSVKKIDRAPFSYCAKLKSINVDKNNKNYKSVNGVLFNKKKTVLIQYPANKSGAKYTVPDGVKVIGKGAFADCRNLKEIVIPKSVKVIEDSAFDFDYFNKGKLKITFEKGSKLKKLGYLDIGVYYNEKKSKYLRNGVTVYYYDSNVKKAFVKINKTIKKDYNVKNAIKLVHK